MTLDAELLDEIEGLKRLLAALPLGALDAGALRDQARRIFVRLPAEERIWVDADEAMRLLDFEFVRAFLWRVEQGIFASRALPDGRLQVSLADVIEHRITEEALWFLGDVPIPDEMFGAQPSPFPWQVEPGARAS